MFIIAVVLALALLHSVVTDVEAGSENQER